MIRRKGYSHPTDILSLYHMLVDTAVHVSHMNPGGFRSAGDQQDSSGFKQKLHAAVETKKSTFSASHKSASRAMCTVVK